MTDSPEPLSAIRERHEDCDANACVAPIASGCEPTVLLATLDAERRLQFEHHQFHHAGGFAASERPPIDPLREAARQLFIDPVTDKYQPRGWSCDNERAEAIRAALASPATPRPEGLDAEARDVVVGWLVAGMMKATVNSDPEQRAFQAVTSGRVEGILARLSDTGERPYIAPPMQDWPDHASLSCDES